MKLVLLLSLAAVLVACAASPQEGQVKQASPYDQVDVSSYGYGNTHGHRDEGEKIGSKLAKTADDHWTPAEADEIR
ncbi:hypothetical protein JYU34_016400 [Plutella xylostella]|uniref:Lipoprotein n=1 Tax=Plutella xylostella TaxID=51655 RepID=A0ABQ7Q2I6_PLUXY|nr:hypothetical protein JYU34_016400 [Plutella xylostella]